MRQIKSERLKKLESELADLEQWLKLGLVPKKDIPKHKEEIASVQEKLEEEQTRLRFLKESGDLEEYVAPKRASGRSGYTEMGTLPDIEITDNAGITEGQYGDSDSDDDTEEDSSDDDDDDHAEDTEDDAFSDHNRWRRGGILDPDADDW